MCGADDGMGQAAREQLVRKEQEARELVAERVRKEGEAEATRERLEVNTVMCLRCRMDEVLWLR